MSSRPKNPRILMAEAVLAELHREAQQQRRSVDDDLPRVPELSPLASAQSRRLVEA